jgi:hypothetical protein
VADAQGPMSATSNIGLDQALEFAGKAQMNGGFTRL